MTYTVYILRRAQKALARLPKRDYERVRDAIRALGAEPRPPGARKLTDRPGWRIRVGVYRILYDIDDAVLIVTVLDIGHRSDVYR